MMPHGRATPSVYVYPLPPELTGEFLYDNITAGDHDFHFRGELELTHRFREMPQAHPSEADMLLVPFMLTQAFTKLRKGRSSPSHASLMRWDADVVAELRKIGPYWDERRNRHAVFSQRCAGPPYERNGLRARSLAVKTWPPLWDANITFLCFEPATYTHMGRGIFIPYGVGHGANALRCPAGSEGSASPLAPPLPTSPRQSQLMFAGSIATNPARKQWVDAMRRVGEPTCRLVLFEKATRKHFNPSDLEAALRGASFSVHLKGHVGPRKAIMDSIRCGSLPLIASDHTVVTTHQQAQRKAPPLRTSDSCTHAAHIKLAHTVTPQRYSGCDSLHTFSTRSRRCVLPTRRVVIASRSLAYVQPFPFSDEIDYSAFALRVPEKANATKVLAALIRIGESQLRSMREAMLRAAHLLDCGPNGGMAHAVLARFVRVSERVVNAVPAVTDTPLPLLKL